MTNRYFTLLFSVAIRLAAAQDPSAMAPTMIGRSDETGTSPKAPRRPTAAESPFYIKVYGFYGLLTPGSQISSSYSASSFKTNTKGLGAGPRAGIGIGTILSDFINVGIDADMLFGANLTTDNTYKGSNYTYSSTTTTTFRVLSIIPNITFKALSRPSYYIYNRLGVVGGIVLDYSTSGTSLNVPTAGATTTGEYQTDYTKNSLSIGYQAALGIQFRLSQSLRGFAEVVAYNQSFKPTESIYTSTSTKSGVVSKYSYINEFKAQGETVTTKRDGVDVYQNARNNVAMNSVGVGVGLLFRF